MRRDHMLPFEPIGPGAFLARNVPTIMTQPSPLIEAGSAIKGQTMVMVDLLRQELLDITERLEAGIAAGRIRGEDGKRRN